MFHISSKSLQLQYVHSGILETNISCIEASLFFIIAIVICTQKKTSISFSFVAIYLTVCCVYWGIFILYYCHCHLYTKNDLNFFFICYYWFTNFLRAIKISMVCNILEDIIISKFTKVLHGSHFNCIFRGYTKFLSFELSVIYSRLPLLPSTCTFYVCFFCFWGFSTSFSFSPSSSSSSDSSSISCLFSFSGHSSGSSSFS